jgi:tetratricopeptide (TPR) repeat protein
MNITHALAISTLTVFLAVPAAAQSPAPEAPPAPTPEPRKSPPRVHVVLPPLPPNPPAPPIVFGDRVELLYDQGRNAIEQGRYDRAVERFDQLIEMKTTRTDAALYWKAYSEDRLGARAKALTTLAELQKQFTESRWIKDAKALEVELRQAAGQTVPTDLQNDEELKLLALRGLIQNDPDQAFPIVEKMLSGSNTPRVKERALFLLAQSQSARAREIVATAAKTGSNPDLQLKAINYLGMMNGPDNRQVLEDVYKSTSDIAVKRAVLRSFMMARDNARLMAVAKTEASADLRRNAIDMLGALRDAAGLVALARVEKDPEVKRDIVSRLSMIKTKEATDYLMELLK